MGMMSNKRGEFESMLLVVVMLFVVGITVFFMSHMNAMFYGKMSKYLHDSPRYNNTEASRVSDKITNVEKSNMWDYGVLLIFFGLIANMIIFSFATRISPVFFWFFAILGTFIVLASVVLSNIWQTWVANPEFAETLSRFPITNALLGNYLASIALGVVFMGSIVLFGKLPGGGKEE